MIRVAMISLSVDLARTTAMLPGFIDVQVNGGGGVLFNDDPSLPNRSTRSAPRIANIGTTGFLPTLISDDLDTIAQAIAAVQRSHWTAKRPGALGIHISRGRF